MMKNIEDLKVEGTVEETKEVKTNVFTKFGGWIKDNRKTIATGFVATVIGGLVGYKAGKTAVQTVTEVVDNIEPVMDNVVDFVQDVTVENFYKN